MDFEILKRYLFNLPDARLEFPQGPDTMVFKILGKAFAYISWQSEPIFVSLKCDPKKAIELRKQYSGLVPGYHMSRTHWNTFFMDNKEIPDEIIHQWVEESYHLAINELPGLLRKRILKKLEKIKEGNS